MASGDTVYQATFTPGLYALELSGSYFTRQETLGDATQSGVDVREYFSSGASAKNRLFDSAKSYQITIKEV